MNKMHIFQKKMFMPVIPQQDLNPDNLIASEGSLIGPQEGVRNMSALREMRRRRGLSMEALAQLAGTSASQINKLEKSSAG